MGLPIVSTVKMVSMEMVVMVNTLGTTNTPDTAPPCLDGDFISVWG